MKQYIFVILLAGVSGLRICTERTCKICDKVQHGNLHDDRYTKYCPLILKIPNCCNRFFQSYNLLGPVSTQAEKITDGKIPSEKPHIYRLISGVCLLVGVLVLLAIFISKKGRKRGLFLKTRSVSTIERFKSMIYRNNNIFENFENQGAAPEPKTLSVRRALYNTDHM